MTLALNRRDFLRSSCLTAGSLMIAGCESAPAAPTPSAPAPSTPAPSTPPPVAASGFPLIADTAARLDAAKARALKAHGVKTIFRYYCHLPPSLPGKDLQPEEAKIILGEGLSLATVFQHYNNCFRTFENKWGREDAEQALRMAQAAGQPSGSAIYFGVDADWPYASLRDPIIAYFEDVKRAFEGSGIAVGVYSNGCICNTILERGLADYFWLSGSTGHSGTQAFYNTGKWTIFQNALDVTPAQVGYAIDADLANSATNGYFGQWNDKGARTATHSPGETSALFAARRFLNANAEVMQDLNPGAASLASLRKDQNVRVLQASGAFTRIVTQEGGASRTAPAVQGYVPTSSLIPMNSFADKAGYGLCGAATVPNDTFKYQNCERATSRLR
ncbi:MAG: DUF1906 domain-containing protein [Hyphomonadaceae bacterium]|nr:DUF1906 domain-containing protein [Hyphomonadaceae bacterium]